MGNESKGMEPVQVYSDEGTIWGDVGAQLRETQRAILDGLAGILEVPTVAPETVLANSGGADWDSLAIVCTIALLDEKASVEVTGEQLVKCETAGDVLKLAGVA